MRTLCSSKHEVRQLLCFHHGLGTFSLRLTSFSSRWPRALQFAAGELDKSISILDILPGFLTRSSLLTQSSQAGRSSRAQQVQGHSLLDGSGYLKVSDGNVWYCLWSFSLVFLFNDTGFSGCVNFWKAKKTNPNLRSQLNSKVGWESEITYG